MTLPLEGIIVLDMSRYLPGGYCTMDRCDDAGRDCPAESICAELEVPTGGVVYFCMRSCATVDDCRAAEGYRCDEGACVP